MFTFRGFPDDGEQLTWRILKVLQRRSAMHIGELRLRVGVDEPTLRRELDMMMRLGTVERLRPMEYPGEDRDFFRVCGEEERTAGPSVVRPTFRVLCPEEQRLGDAMAYLAS